MSASATALAYWVRQAQDALDEEDRNYCLRMARAWANSILAGLMPAF